MNTDGKVLLMRLYEKQSANGNRYFAGRMGAAKVAMFLDKRAEGTDPVWEVFVQDGDDGRGAPPGQPARPRAEGSENPTHRRPDKPRREIPEPLRAAAGWPIPDDPLPSP